MGKLLSLYKQNLYLWSSVLLSLVLVACGSTSTNLGINFCLPNVYSQSLKTSWVHEGTVTGFGDVYIDGLRAQYSGITPMKETFDSKVATVIQLGQRVRFTFVDNLVRTIAVNPQVIGVIDSISGSYLTVSGQKININSGSSIYNTVIAGRSSKFDELRVGDYIEAHGYSIEDPNVVGGTIIDATRVEKLEVPPVDQQNRRKITGYVKQLNNAQKTFVVGNVPIDYSQLPFVPVLKDGGLVNIWGVTQNNGILAAKIALSSLLEENIYNYRFSGEVSRIDFAQKLVNIQGTSVYWSDLNKPLENGRLLQVGDLLVADASTRLGSSADLTIDKVQVNPNLTTVIVNGTVESSMTGNKIIVQGVPIDAQYAVLSGCAGNIVSSGSIVQVAGVGVINTQVLRATTLQCLPVVVPSANATCPATAIASYQVLTGYIFGTPNYISRTASVQLINGQIVPVVWGADTVFYSGIDTLSNGQLVRLEATTATINGPQYGLLSLRQLGTLDIDSFGPYGNYVGWN
ncbi:MAG: DUF5666 domain-containing protein [Gammaproteobacteria bacterium]|nr:DUF5666 domain-containing protein [Gammaproteobacteria bacterium]